MPATKFNFSKEEIYSLYIDQDLTMLEIAKLKNCSESTINKHIIKYSIPKKRSKDYFKIRFSKKLLKKMYEIQQKSTTKIAKELKCSQFYIWKLLHFYNITQRIYYKGIKGRKSPLWKGGKKIPKTIYTYYKQNAQKRGKEFTVTLDYLDKLFIKQKGLCAISGIKLKDPKPIAKRTESDISLDRIDSSKGYIEDNVQWVHKTVNIMKWSLSNDEFIDWCKLIAQNNS